MAPDSCSGLPPQGTKRFPHCVTSWRPMPGGTRRPQKLGLEIPSPGAAGVQASRICHDSGACVTACDTPPREHGCRGNVYTRYTFVACMRKKATICRFDFRKQLVRSSFLHLIQLTRPWPHSKKTNKTGRSHKTCLHTLHRQRKGRLGSPASTTQRTRLPPGPERVRVLDLDPLPLQPPNVRKRFFRKGRHPVLPCQAGQKKE
nr:uncharacterized protein LOC121829437 [Peromyscus maniculatus bairdii]